MTQLTALAWKEWRENRWFVAAGLFVFLGLPLLGGVMSKLSGYPRFEILAWPWVFYLGGVLAVFVGVSAGTRDFAGRLEAFWRSRPIDPGRWLLAKYAVGLAGLLLTCMVPLAAEAWVGERSTYEPLSAHRMLGWGPFHWAVLYTAAFLIGCLFRRPAQATTLAFAVLALVYFAPVVLPPLERLSVTWVADAPRDRQVRNDELPHPWAFGRRPEQVPFVVTMAGLSIALLALAVVAVRRGWEVHSGWRTMYASIGSALFVLFAAAAFQLGSNLPVLQGHKLGDDERVVAVYSDGTNGVLFTGTARGWATPLSAVRA